MRATNVRWEKYASNGRGERALTVFGLLRMAFLSAHLLHLRTIRTKNEEDE
jgi:hypothetical protein